MPCLLNSFFKQIIHAILKQMRDVDTLMFMVDLRIFQSQDFHLMPRYYYIYNQHQFFDSVYKLKSLMYLGLRT